MSSKEIASHPILRKYFCGMELIILIVHFRTVRESWIRAKYIQKAFVRRLPLGEDGAAQSGSTEGNKTFLQQF